MKNKRLLAALAALCLLAAVMAAVWHSLKPTGQEGLKHFTVEVVHSDGSKAEFSYQTDKTYLGELLVEEGLISGEKSTYGLYVETVDGETVDFAANGSWWYLACNGEEAMTGADMLELEDGAVYTWTYTTT